MSIHLLWVERRKRGEPFGQEQKSGWPSPDILLTVFLFDIGMWYLQDYYPEQFSLFMLVPLISRHSKKNGLKGGGGGLIGLFLEYSWSWWFSFYRVQTRYHRVFGGLHFLTFLMNVWPPAKSNVDHEKCTKSNVTVFLLYA